MIQPHSGGHVEAMERQWEAETDEKIQDIRQAANVEDVYIAAGFKIRQGQTPLTTDGQLVEPLDNKWTEQEPLTDKRRDDELVRLMVVEYGGTNVQPDQTIKRATYEKLKEFGYTTEKLEELWKSQ